MTFFVNRTLTEALNDDGAGDKHGGFIKKSFCLYLSFVL